MELPRWDARSTGMSVEGVGVLARSPLYPQWRTEVEKVFARIDDAVADAGALKAVNRLIVCVLPAHLPLPRSPLWPDLEKQASSLLLDEPLGKMLPDFAAALAARPLRPGVEDVEATWIFELGAEAAAPARSASATVISWTALAATRREFLNRLNTISRSLKSVDQTHEELKRLDISRMLGPSLGGKPRLREFVRTLLLSGNGALVFNNSFVEWGASEALRRVQPQVTMACFGIRQKLKPFSSTVLFEDQSRSNPAPDEDDPAGSLEDGVLLARYVHLAAERVPAYQDRTLTLLAAQDLDQVLVLGPKAALPASARVSSQQLTAFALAWLAG
jgi:hypothetical protein